MTQKRANVYIYIYIILVFSAICFIGLVVFPEKSAEDVLGLPNHLVTLFAALIIVSPIFFLNWQKRESRTKDFIKTASKFGWEYQKNPKMPFLKSLAKGLSIDLRHPLKSFLTQGLSGKINGWNFVICDGRYDRGNDGEGPDEYIYQTFFALHIKGADFPLFGLEPKTIGNRLHNLLAKFDINFNTHPKFSKNYALYGHNETMIRQLFIDKTLTLFEMQKNLSTFGYKNHLVMYQKKKQCDPINFENELKLSVKIAKAFLKSDNTENLLSKKPQADKNKTDSPQQKSNVQYW